MGGRGETEKWKREEGLLLRKSCSAYWAGSQQPTGTSTNQSNPDRTQLHHKMSQHAVSLTTTRRQHRPEYLHLCAITLPLSLSLPRSHQHFVLHFWPCCESLSTPIKPKAKCMVQTTSCAAVDGLLISQSTWPWDQCLHILLVSSSTS